MSKGISKKLICCGANVEKNVLRKRMVNFSSNEKKYNNFEQRRQPGQTQCILKIINYYNIYYYSLTTRFVINSIVHWQRKVLKVHLILFVIKPLSDYNENLYTSETKNRTQCFEKLRTGPKIAKIREHIVKIDFTACRVEIVTV